MARKLLTSIALILPLLIVFKSIFLPGPLAWGDAPHLFPEEARELVSQPLAWTNIGHNFGGVNNSLWLSPIRFIYGLVGILVGNDLAVRILFYVPSLILAGVGSYFFSKYLKLSKTVQFFSVLVYLLNTYYLMLVDGGQVGIALAYGFFPLTLLYLKKLMDTPSIKNFYLALLFLVLNGLSDPRVTIISLITIAIWQILELKIKPLLYLFSLFLCWLAINLYWIYPLLKNGSSSSPIFSSELKIINWYNALLLFSPHWPSNLFGKISSPPLYFLGVPLLILSGLIVGRERKTIIFGLLFLILALLSFKIPLIEKVPFGSAFRDTTKFFIPVGLFGGILIGNTISRFKSFWVSFASYLFILLLIYPALFGRLNFVLSNRKQSSDFQKIYENLKGDSSDYRTAWFPERHPLAYETEKNPGVSAKELARFWPFATLNAGEDVFNFLNNVEYVEGLKVLGIKYLILSDNPREISKSESEQRDWNTILGLTENNKKLEKVDWGATTPIYKVNDTYPRFFAVKRLVGVIGPPLTTSYLLPATLFFEDGKLNPKALEGLDSNSVTLVFNGTDRRDLAISFLQKYFLSPAQASKSQWASYSKDQYLKYKYELLIRGINFTDFDYGRGIAFSTQKGEKIEFEFEVPVSGKYIFAYRSMVPSSGQPNLRWERRELKLSEGIHTETIENNYDLQILNTVALIPKAEFDGAEVLAETFTEHFEVVKADDLNEEFEYQAVDTQSSESLKYKLTPPGGYNWIIFTDNYHPLWQVRRGVEYYNSVPVYSMVNGFYVDDAWTDLEVEFRGQENVIRGIYLSVLSVVIISIGLFWFYSKRNG